MHPTVLPIAILALMVAPLAAAEVTLTVSEAGIVGAPLFASVDVTEGGARSSHQEMALRVYEGDTLVFETGSIHEHDAYHPFVVTPRRAGALRIEVDADGQTSTATIPIAPATATTAPEGELQATLGAATLQTNATHVLWDFLGPDGRHLLSLWQDTSGGAQVLGTNAPEGSLVTAYLARDAATGGPGRILRAVSESDGSFLLGSLTSFAPPCDASVITDPNSATPGILSWQAGSDIRIHAPGATSASVVPVATDLLTSADSIFVGLGDPSGTLTFHARTPDLYTLQVIHPDGDCNLQFLVVPAPLEDDGHVEASVDVQGDGVDVALTPFAADGTVLSHYEFDTRVFRTGDDASLVWQGKLHGHGGPVAFHMAGLPAGEYEVVTYPSPQAVDMASVAPTGPDGFRYPFTIQTADQEPHRETTAAPAPAPALVAVLVGLVAVALLRRR